jgi:hypothetical protein
MSEFIVTDNECALHVSDKHCTPIEVLQKITDIPGADPSKIVDDLKSKTKCTTELCIIKSKSIGSKLGRDIVNRIIDTYFKVQGPKLDVEKWLSNHDIDNTLIQWQKIPEFKTFYHIPFQMRDFQEKNTELATLNFVQLYNEGYRTFGCVLNTDWSSGNGQHWFAFFFDFRQEPYTIEYFNSSGECPLREFNKWLNDKQQQLQSEFNKPVDKIIATRVQNQYDNSSCGCYSLYYIYSRLNGVPWQWFRDNIVPDKKMHEFRKFLFNEPIKN